MFYRSTTLSSSHYAGKWSIPAEDQRYDLKGRQSTGPRVREGDRISEKEAKLLQVLECFHGYLMKYVVMIIRGTIPPLGTCRQGCQGAAAYAESAWSHTRQGADRQACKTLHLAFKQATTEEIYDTLVFCLIKAARKYDSFYTDKVEEVCGIINVLPKQFTEQHLLDRVGPDCLGILRTLVRKHYLRSVTGKRVVGYIAGQI